MAWLTGVAWDPWRRSRKCPPLLGAGGRGGSFDRLDRRFAYAVVLAWTLCGIASLRGADTTAQSSAADDERGLIALARAAVVSEVTGKPVRATGEGRPVSAPRVIAKSPPKPVFVTIERKWQVLGCRGSLECRTRSLKEEVALAARAACHDPRHRPLTRRDLADFQVTVTVVERLESLDRIETLTPAEGLVLKSGRRTGVVLPWEGKDPKVRLKWAYKKAGVAQGAACRLYRMGAERIRG